jgi:uncharacterized protein YukJ
MDERKGFLEMVMNQGERMNEWGKGRGGRWMKGIVEIEDQKQGQALK